MERRQPTPGRRGGKGCRWSGGAVGEEVGQVGTPGRCLLALAGCMELGEGLAWGANLEPQLAPSCKPLLPPGHAAYTCTCWLRTAWSRHHALILLGLPAAGVGGASCELHRGRQGEVGGPQHLVSTWLPSPSEVQEHWGSTTCRSRTHQAQGPQWCRGFASYAIWESCLGVGSHTLALGWVGFDLRDGAEVPVEAACTLHRAGLLGPHPLGSCY